MLENYREPEDLLSDESFLSWYFKTGPVQDNDWELWMAARPERVELVHQAVELLNTARIREKEMSGQQVTTAEAALMRKIGELPTVSVTVPNVVPLLGRRRSVAAASILLLLAAGLFITKRLIPGKPQVSAPYGQIREQKLPDGTQVVMNANSQVTYSPDWKDGLDREVWVNGEAFFHVSKTPMKSRFIVHTDHFDIIVTGTQFNVVNRHDRDNVMLKEGSVIIHGPDGRELYMAPGDFVEFRKEQLKKTPVRNDSLLAWKEHKLVFENTPLRELVTIIHDQYGIKVKLADDSIGRRTISGILPNNNLDVLLQALEATMEFDIIRQEDDITIKSHFPAN